MQVRQHHMVHDTSVISCNEAMSALNGESSFSFC